MSKKSTPAPAWVVKPLVHECGGSILVVPQQPVNYGEQDVYRIEVARGPYADSKKAVLGTTRVDYEFCPKCGQPLLVQGHDSEVPEIQD